MEDGLVPEIGLLVVTAKSSVLILVVMEDGLVLMNFGSLRMVPKVLILVVMEDGLVLYC